ncbi:hypothetical protein TWF192_006419 [Orbilia oligospora]|uniref:Uncharacterized protein n=1 Tax=Orbilia oligospora TaxID=2813651 RepID=A0A6G1M796_ORBOL|nr:hypothetical protein TWF191_007791 [Orbilia oligospora]KAF3247929.1 hypothetical protein TWF192_006419 [Orbilia oligospora]
MLFPPSYGESVLIPRFRTRPYETPSPTTHINTDVCTFTEFAMADIRTRILEAADAHISLISQMSDLEHAPFTLEQQSKYLADLKKTLTSLKTELEKLRKITSKERKGHQDLRDSFARRYAHKLTGRSEKFVSKIEKEEREYLDALHNERAAEEKERYLEDTIAETENRVAELTTQTNQYVNLKEQSEQLYKKVFDGPTPEFPEEDQMEVAVQHAKDFFAEAQSRCNSDQEAEKLMFKAEKSVARAVKFCDEALSASSWDVWGGGTVADMIERDNLSKAKSTVSQAQMLLGQAIDLQDAIGPFDTVKVAGGHTTEIFLDNPVSDYEFHKKVKETYVQMRLLHQKVQLELQAQRGRALDSKNNMEDAKAQLAAARGELEKVRREVFERVTGISCSAGTPPAYDAMDSPPALDPEEILVA